jgi:hypothetical protein
MTRAQLIEEFTARPEGQPRSYGVTFAAWFVKTWPPRSREAWWGMLLAWSRTRMTVSGDPL